MTRAELEHAIRAACDIAQDDAVYVFGSQAILGQYPEAPARLRQSIEVDIAPRTRVDRTDAIDGAIGMDSPFHAEFGFYVHGLPIESASLPAGWEARVIRVQGPNTFGHTGLCLEGHDLAASKIAAFRPKDKDFVRVLLEDRLISAGTLVERIETLDVADAERTQFAEWVRITARALGVFDR